MAQITCTPSTSACWPSGTPAAFRPTLIAFVFKTSVLSPALPGPLPTEEQGRASAPGKHNPWPWEREATTRGLRGRLKGAQRCCSGTLGIQKAGRIKGLSLLFAPLLPPRVPGEN